MTLIGRVQDGDENALDRLFSRYIHPLSAWAHCRLPPHARGLLETDDLVQEALLRTLSSIDQFEAKRAGALHAYLRTAILNRIRDELRRVKAKRPADESASGIVDRGPTPQDRAIWNTELEQYDAALMAQRPEAREALIARLELGMSYREIAIALDKPSADAARMMVTRALAQLAERMRRDGG